MKKNKKRLGVLAMTLLLILAIGATAGTTLAKYISSAKVDSQTATVAKWGFTFTVDTKNMFGESYATDEINSAKDKNKLASVATEGDTIVAKATSKGNIVAPGTKGSMSLTLNGKSEVNAILEINLGKDFKTVFLHDGETLNYYPIKWTIGKKNDKKVEVKAENINDLAKAVYKAVCKQLDDKDYVENEGTESETISVRGDLEAKGGPALYIFIPAGTQLKNLDLTIAWEWAFEQKPEEEDELDKDDYNILDTILGYLANNTDYSELEYTENVIDWLEGHVADHEADKSAENFYNNLKGNNEDGISSSTKISINFEASVYQTQRTREEFNKEWGDFINPQP